eukprot:TRINITY_DN521_c0_g1_i1.p1 TRINITY_DN521_c0_g1~~TRINITY_DN521_c0_g1_i1.p1  ORF type:complete len:243 (+),score=82.10 TRINITY_DN521_c0_g1_i1:20-748(+)
MSIQVAESCDNCFKGAIVGSGKVEKYAGVDSYIARPTTQGKSAIVYSTDVFGVALKQAQEISDSLAAAGFFVVTPDVFSGDQMAPDFDFGNKEATGKWFGNHDAKTKVATFEKVIAQVRADGYEKIGTLGYCYGARAALLLAGEKKVDAYVVGHPTAVRVPEEIDSISVPGLFLLAETDFAFNEEAEKKTKEVLTAKSGVETQFIKYPGTQHGFAVRGDEHGARDQKAKALQDTIAFFKSKL